MFLRWIVRFFFFLYFSIACTQASLPSCPQVNEIAKNVPYIPGGVVYCQKSNSNELFGYYSLDYVLFYTSEYFKELLTNEEFKNIFFDNQMHYHWALSADIPAAYFYIMPFVESFISEKNDFDGFHLWTPGKFTPLEFNDILANQFPANCLKSNKLVVHRTFVLTNPNELPLRYFYDEEILGQIKKTNPLQLSFVLDSMALNEQFRQNSKHPKILSALNACLHTTVVKENLSQELLVSELGNPVFMPICQRHQVVKSILEQILNKSCDDITAQDLLTIQSLTIRLDNEKTAFHKDDFSGLHNLKSLTFRDQWRDVDPTTTLTARHKNQLFPPRIFEDLANLKELNLSKMLLSNLPPAFLSGLTKLQNINLGQNSFLELHYPIFLSARGLVGEASPGVILNLQQYHYVLSPTLFEGADFVSEFDLSNTAFYLPSSLEEYKENSSFKNLFIPFKKLKKLKINGFVANNFYAPIVDALQNPMALRNLESLEISDNIYFPNVIINQSRNKILLKRPYYFAYGYSDLYKESLAKEWENVEILDISNSQIESKIEALPSLKYMKHLIVKNIEIGRYYKFWDELLLPNSLPSTIEEIDLCFNNPNIQEWSEKLKKHWSTAPFHPLLKYAPSCSDAIEYQEMKL